ncbi:MAG: glycine--tRNA ligase [Candidatus Peribacteria bacterium]|nr:MAG: glycine--tRNA ligase [Candidatus Peribacteria bacterium]
MYGGLANAWDYGPYGVQLKKNIQDLWRKTFVQKRQDVVGLDSQILMHPKVWETSGHTDNFNDPLIDDKKTGERFRADKLIEEAIENLKSNIRNTNIVKQLTELFDKAQIAKADIEENLNLLEEAEKKEKDYNIINLIQEQKEKSEEIILKGIDIEKNDNPEKVVNELALKYIASILNINNLIPESRSFDLMKEFIVKFIPNNPNTKKPAERTDVRKFQMMFYTYQGVTHTEDDKIWMRPETAQGIFVNFKNVLDTTRVRVPFGIAQIGKAFRNEITPGNFLYRTREFEQMEIEYFVPADLTIGKEFLEQRKQQSMTRWQDIIGFKSENLHFREHEEDELSHYSAGTFDVEYQYPRGWGELQGIAYRTDFDLSRHQEASRTKMLYNDPFTGERYVPHVIEPSFGLSRTVLAAMFDAYDEEDLGDGDVRTVLRFDPKIAPVSFAIFPLIKKDEDQVRIAEEIFADLSQDYVCEYDDGGAIGKRYRRQDEIGTPYCITVDHDSVDDGTVTIRHRDSMEQERVKIETLRNFMK